MAYLTSLLDQYGYLLLFALGFVEFAGLPVASVPVLVLAGALSATGVVGLPPAVAAVALGGLLGDGLWFAVARAHGLRVVDRACGLSTNPRACIHNVTTRLGRIGSGYILPAKFIPGAGNLIAAAAGLRRVPPATFLALDLVALTLWAATYLTLGRYFSGTVEVVVAWAEGVIRSLTVTSLGLILVAAVWRIAKVRLHRTRHGVGGRQAEGGH